MPLAFGPDFVEGKVYRSKKRQDGDEEKQALRELQTLLNLKNRRSCGCEAQIHDLLENCLNCGRLTCIAEGSGKCFSCGSLILSQDQRERLQKFIEISSSLNTNQSQPSKSNDSSRLKIIDDQFDHFAIDNKRHLRGEQKQKLKDNLEELQAKRFQRKLVLEVDIDNLHAGSRSTAKIDDYEGELRRLEINNDPRGGNSNLTLAELVEREYRDNQPFQYTDPDLTKADEQKPVGNSGDHALKKPQQKQKTEFRPQGRDEKPRGDKSKNTKKGAKSTSSAWTTNKSNRSQ